MNYAIEILRSARKQLERIASEHSVVVVIAHRRDAYRNQ